MNLIGIEAKEVESSASSTKCICTNRKRKMAPTLRTPSKLGSPSQDANDYSESLVFAP